MRETHGPDLSTATLVAAVIVVSLLLAMIVWTVRSASAHDNVHRVIPGATQTIPCEPEQFVTVTCVGTPPATMPPPPPQLEPDGPCWLPTRICGRLEHHHRRSVCIVPFWGAR